MEHDRWNQRGQGLRRNVAVKSLRAEPPGRAILVLEFLPGTEYGVGVIGNPGRNLTVLPPLEVDYGGLDPALPSLLGFESHRPCDRQRLR